MVNIGIGFLTIHHGCYVMNLYVIVIRQRVAAPKCPATAQFLCMGCASTDLRHDTKIVAVGIAAGKVEIAIQRS